MINVERLIKKYQNKQQTAPLRNKKCKLIKICCKILFKITMTSKMTLNIIRHHPFIMTLHAKVKLALDILQRCGDFAEDLWLNSCGKKWKTSRAESLNCGMRS